MSMIIVIFGFLLFIRCGYWPIDRDLIIERAKSWIGVLYDLGGDSRSGIDCTHYIHRVYEEAGLTYPYCWTGCFRNNKQVNLTKISIWDLQIGDIIIFEAENGNATGYGHAGLITAKNEFIGAQRPHVGYKSYCDLNYEPDCTGYWGATRKVSGYYVYDPLGGDNSAELSHENDVLHEVVTVFLWLFFTLVLVCACPVLLVVCCSLAFIIIVTLTFVGAGLAGVYLMFSDQARNTITVQTNKKVEEVSFTEFDVDESMEF